MESNLRGRRRTELLVSPIPPLHNNITTTNEQTHNFGWRANVKTNVTPIVGAAEQTVSFNSSTQEAIGENPNSSFTTLNDEMLTEESFQSGTNKVEGQYGTATNSTTSNEVNVEINHDFGWEAENVTLSEELLPLDLSNTTANVFHSRSENPPLLPNETSGDHTAGPQSSPAFYDPALALTPPIFATSEESSSPENPLAQESSPIVQAPTPTVLSITGNPTTGSDGTRPSITQPTYHLMPSTQSSWTQQPATSPLHVPSFSSMQPIHHQPSSSSSGSSHSFASSPPPFSIESPCRAFSCLTMYQIILLVAMLSGFFWCLRCLSVCLIRGRDYDPQQQRGVYRKITDYNADAFNDGFDEEDDIFYDNDSEIELHDVNG